MEAVEVPAAPVELQQPTDVNPPEVQEPEKDIQQPKPEKQQSEDEGKPEEEQAPEPPAEVEEPKSTAKKAKTPAKPTPPKPKSAEKAAPASKAKPAAPPADAGVGRAKRERKQVEIFQVEVKKEEEFVIPEGKGTKLRDIPNVAFKLSKITGKDELLESFHNVLYRRKGSAHNRKKAILDFSGFVFSEEKEREARETSLGKWKVDLIHKLMDTLDMPRGGGDKMTKINAVMTFLQEPKQLSDTDLASKEAARKAKDKAKREKAKKGKEVKRKAPDTKKAPAKKAKKATVVEESDEELESEPEDEESEEASDFEAEVLPKKKKAAPSSAKKPSAEKKKKEAAPEPMETEEDAEEDPSAKISHDDLKKVVYTIMAGLTREELETFSAKGIVAKTTAHYGFNMKPRKKDLVAIAGDWINENPMPAAEEPANDSPADDNAGEEKPAEEPEAAAAAPVDDAE